MNHKYISSCLSSDPCAGCREAACSVISLTSHLHHNFSVRERMDSENSDQYQILKISLT